MKAKALVAALLWCLCSFANAVYLSPDELGQILIYPYFTAQAFAGSPMNTYLSIVNQRGAHKALRVRVREGRNGREVASFNLMLPSMDTWTGAIVPSAGGARIVTRDRSCTDPAFAAQADGSSSLDFTDHAFTGSAADGMGTDAGRLREGYVEVIEMASSTLFGPMTCDAFRAGTLFDAQNIDTGIPDDGLAGTFTLINVASGMEFSANPTALAGAANKPFFRPAADPYPDLDAAEIAPTAALTIDGTLYRASTASGLAAIEAVLTKQTVANELVLDAATKSGTDWVFTMPTRRFHTGTASDDPFVIAFVPGSRDVDSTLQFFSREVQPFGLMQNGCPDTCLPGQYSADLRLPWTSTVWTFGKGSSASASKDVSDALGAQNAWRITLPTTAENGYASVVFGHAGRTVPRTSFNASSLRLADASAGSGSFRLIGLPVVGFMARTFHNGFLDCAGSVCQGNYGGLFPHKWQGLIGPNP